MSDPLSPAIVRTFQEAVAILDQSEIFVRDLIEHELADVAGINRTKVSDAMLARDALTAKIAAVRLKYIKLAFKHLETNLPRDEFDSLSAPEPEPVTDG